MAPSWSCDCCCETFRDYTSINIDGNSVCVKCVRQMFDKALRFEHNYPPKWSSPIHPTEFSHIFSLEYVKDYMVREIEYKTPPNRRVYCQHDVQRVKLFEDHKSECWTEKCGGYVGERRKFIKDGTLVFGRCRSPACEKVTCMVCEYHNNDAEEMLQHICLGKSCANEKRDQAFSGLKPGKDWQQCPNRQCGRRIELSEACNHISCQCGMGFCFICGKEADGESEHWRKGGCPRYHQPGDADVEYDNYDDDDDDDDDDRLSSTGEHNERGSDADVLENIRDLFEVDEGSVESPELPTHAILDDMELRVAAAVSPGMRPPTADQLAEDSPVLDQLAEPTSAEAREEPEMPELIAIAPNDAEAIANAFLEDDLSDDGHFVPLLPSPPGHPILTSEEADIDQALWRMAVE